MEGPEDYNAQSAFSLRYGWVQHLNCNLHHNDARGHLLHVKVLKLLPEQRDAERVGGEQERGQVRKNGRGSKRNRIIQNLFQLINLHGHYLSQDIYLEHSYIRENLSWSTLTTFLKI